MKVKLRDNLILVNMPDCSNRLFEFNNGKIVNSRKIAYKNANNALSYYVLTFELQNQIAKFLNPKAI